MVRRASVADADLICDLVLELAEYEKARPGDTVTTPEAIRDALAGSTGHRLDGLIAEDEAGRPVGCALFFRAYSTWRANWGVYLEDLFVRPADRGKGHGIALLRAVAQEAVRLGAHRMDWVVLDWNAPAIDFYESIGARGLQDWTVMRLDGDALHRLANDVSGD
jgi:GNAT superfamily N-acetyltransferase